MSIVPFLVGGLSYYCISQYELISSWMQLLVGILLFSVVYIPLFYGFSMNQEERKLILLPIRRFLHKIKVK